MAILPRFLRYRSLNLRSTTSGGSTPDLSYKPLSAKFYLGERSTELSKMERKYCYQGSTGKNRRKNTREEATLLWLRVMHVGENRHTVGFSGGGAFLRCVVARQVTRLLRRRRAAAAVRFLLWARAACVEKRAREMVLWGRRVLARPI